MESRNPPLLPNSSSGCTHNITSVVKSSWKSLAFMDSAEALHGPDGACIPQPAWSCGFS